MNEIILIALGSLLLIILGWIIVRKRDKKIKLKEKQIPEEILNNLNEIELEYERRRKQDANTNPYKISWEITRRNNYGETDTGTNRTEQTANSRELLQQSSGGQTIQSISSSRDKELSEVNRQPKRNSSRNFFRKFRR